MTTLNVNDLRPDDQKGDYLISLTKLTQQPIKDIEGYISDEGWGPFFKLTAIVLADGSKLDVEGEHDMPYIAYISEDKLHRLDDDTLRLLHSQQKD